VASSGSGLVDGGREWRGSVEGRSGFASLIGVILVYDHISLGPYCRDGDSNRGCKQLGKKT
jgi:hypothetical protein